MEPDRREHLKAYWNGKAPREAGREQENPAKTIHTDLLLRMITRHLPPGLCSVLDAGGGTGRFSLPIARMGHHVTHVDISNEMLRLARENATREGVTLDFAEATVTDLSRWPDRSFDFVICLDALVSFCHREYPSALNELVRVTRRTLVLSVFNRTGIMINGGIEFDLASFGRLSTATEVYRHGNLDVNAELLQIMPTLMPSWHAFTADELVAELSRRGLKVVELSATGTMSRNTSPEQLKKVMGSGSYDQYLAFEEAVDSRKDLLGIGSPVASGLSAVAERAG